MSNSSPSSYGSIQIEQTGRPSFSTEPSAGAGNGELSDDDREESENTLLGIWRSDIRKFSFACFLVSLDT